MYQQRPTVYPGMAGMYNNTASSMAQNAAPRVPPRPVGSTVPGRSVGQPYGAGSYGGCCVANYNVCTISIKYIHRFFTNKLHKM